MKIFTVEEANRLLPEITPRLAKIKQLYARVESMKDDALAAAGAADQGGGMAGGTAYVNTLYVIGKLTTELHDMGVELKDHGRGLIDLPSMRGDRIVYLCWQEGDGDRIEWWHELDAGFAGRQPL